MSTIPSENPDRIPPYWHTDGDVVLSVLDPRDNKEHKFCIHKAILAIHSPIFRDMLELGSSRDVDCEVGKDVIRLQDDSVEDVRTLMTALYKCLFVFFFLISVFVMPELSYSTLIAPRTIDSNMALSLLRMGHKYLIQDLQTAMVRLLKERWPLQREKYLTLKKESDSDPTVRDCVSLINIARLTSADVLLPTAFYELSLASHSEWGDDQWKELQRLSGADVTRLMKGKSRIVKRYEALHLGGTSERLWDNSKTEEMRTFIYNHRVTFPSCLRRVNNYPVTILGRQIIVFYCRGALEIVKPELGQRLVRERSGGLWNFFENIVETIGSVKDEVACQHCKTWMASLLRNKAVEVWENVPVDFDLPKIDQKEYADDLQKKRAL